MIGISKNSDFFKNLLATGHYENVFSVHIGKDGAKSHLTFGGFNPAYMATPDIPPSYFSNLSGNSWRIKTTGLMFGTTVTFNSKFTDTNVMINSNEIVMPLGDFDKIIDSIKLLHKTIIVKEKTTVGNFYFEGACP